MSGVHDHIMETLEKGPVHVTLIDPDKQPPSKSASIASEACEGGTDIILVGGTTGVEASVMEEALKAIKGSVGIPVVIFPASSVSVSSYADAILFMSLMNSRSVRYVNREAVMGSHLIREIGLETIPTGYIVVEPGMLVGEVGEVDLIGREDCRSASCYALAAQFFGMKLFYLEGGSGVIEHLPLKMITSVKEAIDIPLVVGGGIKGPSEALDVVRAGVDIVVTGTLVEVEKDIQGAIRSVKKGMLEGWSERI